MIDVEYGMELAEFGGKIVGYDEYPSFFDHYKYKEDAYLLFKALTEVFHFNFKHLEIGGWIATNREGQHINILPSISLEDAMTSALASLYENYQKENVDE